MLALRIKYTFFCLILMGFSCLKAQSTDDLSVVTIIGDDPIEANTAHDFYTTNPYAQPTAPPKNQKIINDNQKTITPSLENGFHMRFEISPTQIPERLGGASFVSPAFTYDTEYDKIQKRSVSIEERKFNAKKKFRKWIPKRKKKYRPTLCGRF